MGKFHALGLGSFSSNKNAEHSSKQQPSSTSRAGSACASPVSTAAVTATVPTSTSVGPLTLGHQTASKEQQLLPHMVADVVTEDTDRLTVPVAIISRLTKASDNSKQHHDVHGPLPEAQLQYSNLANKMLRMVNELRATGADVSLELPTIVVCGQQSAGKSSVVENICGIPLPRAADTCTRCPTEVRLSQQPPGNGLLWEASVKLRREPNLRQRAPGHSSNSSDALVTQHGAVPNHRQAAYNTVGSTSTNKAHGSLYPAIPGQQALHTLQQPSAPPLDQQQQQDCVPSDLPSLETVFRAGIVRPQDLPAAVSAAQACLLSASPAAGDYSKRSTQHVSSFGHGTGTSPLATADAASGGLQAAAAETREPAGLKFSRDVVVVEVAGAPVDLTLIDLPGIIHNVERPEDEHYKALVTDLAERYMRRPRVVIVCTVTCTADIDTQGVLSMAREADPRGLRTLGVLTKPDQVEEGCHAQWLQVLQGNRYPLQLGWYVVKNPNQASLLRGTTSVTARQQEDTFFEATSPWSRLALDQKARLGTLRLREAMSKQLVKMAATARPVLMAAAQEQLVVLRAELASLPPAAVLGDGHAEMLRLIDDVSANIHEEVLARSQSKQFYQHLITLFQQLKTRLVTSRPCFLLPRAASTTTCNSSSLLAVSCALDDDLAHADDLCMVQQVAGPPVSAEAAVARGSEGGGTPPTRLGSYNIFSGSLNSNPGKPGLSLLVAGGTSSSAAPAGGQGAALVVAAGPHQVLLPADSQEARRGLTLDDVRQLVEQHHSIELPGFSPYSAVQELVSRHQTGWTAAAEDCVAAAHRQLLQLVLLHVARTFSRFPAAAEHIRDLATELLEELNSETTAAVEGLVAMELSGTLFAVSRREFSRASSQHLESLRMLLASNFSSSAVPAVGAASSSSCATHAHPDALSSEHATVRSSTSSHPALPTAATGHAGLYDMALANQGIVLPPIPATATGTPELLSMMAAALTYYSLACRRLSDTVSMSIMHHLVTAFTTRFRSRLASALLSLSSESVAAMLVEDEASAARRASLTARKNMLEQAMKVMRAAV